MNKTDVRKYFPHTLKGLIYLNHAAISPMSNRVKSAIERFISDRNNGQIDNFEEWMEITSETRQLISQLIHTDGTDRITFVGNTSDGLSAVTEGMTWNEGDEIILNTMEFPANIQPFRILENRGVELIYLKPDESGRITPEMIENAITPSTKMVSISAVQFLSGFRADLPSIGKICKENDVYFVVDGIQALGTSPINVQESNIDALASGCHKWMMSPMGIGFLYLSEKLASHLKPAKTGWLSVEIPWELSNFNQEWQPVSQHLETGTYNMNGIIGLHASLSNLLELGIDAINNEISELINHLFANVAGINGVSILTPETRNDRAGIFSFSLSGDLNAENIVNQLKEKNMIISIREGFLRISPHYYNTIEELDRVLEVTFNE